MPNDIAKAFKNVKSELFGSKTANWPAGSKMGQNKPNWTQVASTSPSVGAPEYC